MQRRGPGRVQVKLRCPANFYKRLGVEVRAIGLSKRERTL